MPHDSAQVKVEAVRAFGATVDLINVSEISRRDRVEQLAAESGQAYIASPFNDPLVIDGNASLGDELAALGRAFDAVLVPVGGGGLMAGVLQSFAQKKIATRVFGAEPTLANDAARSLREGRVVANESEPQTIADGTRTVSLGRHNWPIIHEHAAGIIEVSEDQIREGVRSALRAGQFKSGTHRRPGDRSAPRGAGSISRPGNLLRDHRRECRSCDLPGVHRLKYLEAADFCYGLIGF